MNAYLVEADNLIKHFPVSSGLFSRDHRYVRAVDGVSLRIRPGESYALVGESGCGKTTLGRLLIGLIKATAGRVLFDGRDLATLSASELRALRRDIQVIFQNPYASLNPRKTIAQILSKPFRIHTRMSGGEIEKEVLSLLDRVGLHPVGQFLNRYPHELSGGQRQRIVIARAIALRPKFIVADEPVSALDVSVRSQILNLMKDLQTELSLTYLLISHDLSVVRSICDRVAVMYLGKIVELGTTEELFENPFHPYTRALMAAAVASDPELMRKRSGTVLYGDVPSPIAPPPGCAFHTRCSIRQVDCDVKKPALEPMDTDHCVACFYTELLAPWDLVPQELTQDSTPSSV